MSSLLVLSARISYRGPDRLDVTRQNTSKANSPEDGRFLAPSWAILRPALEARKHAERLLEETLGIDATARATAEDWLATSWAVYVREYLAEMRRSYVEHRGAWNALLARPRVVLCCYCTDPEHCHRFILRTRILPALGAVDGGEVKP